MDVPWSESSISMEVENLRLEENTVEIGEVLSKGQILARLDNKQVSAEFRRQTAVVFGAEATLQQASANAQRARRLELGATGVQSRKDSETAFVAKKIAQAAQESERANLELERIKLAHAEITAPDDGVMSANPALIGAMPSVGTELFLLIRQQRLEWHAEVHGAAIDRTKIAQSAILTANSEQTMSGIVVRIDPSFDKSTGRGIVYIALAKGALRAGAYATVEICFGAKQRTVVPDTAVSMRSGLTSIYLLADDGKVKQVEVKLGLSRAGMVEIASPSAADAKVIGGGSGFLFDRADVTVASADEIQP